MEQPISMPHALVLARRSPNIAVFTFSAAVQRRGGRSTSEPQDSGEVSENTSGNRRVPISRVITFGLLRGDDFYQNGFGSHGVTIIVVTSISAQRIMALTFVLNRTGVPN